jgi:hypothetical protein
LLGQQHVLFAQASGLLEQSIECLSKGTLFCSEFFKFVLHHVLLFEDLMKYLVCDTGRARHCGSERTFAGVIGF